LTGEAMCTTAFSAVGSQSLVASYSGDANYLGSSTSFMQTVNAAGTSTAATGYWLVGSDGGAFAFGDAKYHGSLGDVKLTNQIVGIAATPASAPAVSVVDAGSFAGNAVTLTLGCVSACTGTVTINVKEAVTAGASPSGSTASRTKKTRTKTVTLGASRFAIHANRSKKLTVKLTRAGKRFLAAHHDRLNAQVVVSEKGNGGIVRTTSSVKITPTKSHKK
jgi:hypothetical protein